MTIGLPMCESIMAVVRPCSGHYVYHGCIAYLVLVLLYPVSCWRLGGVVLLHLCAAAAAYYYYYYY